MSQLKLIETQRLILNDLKHEDTDAVFSIFSNDAVLEFYDVKKFTSIHQAQDLIDKMHERFKNQQGYMSEVLSRMLLDLKENLLFTQKISFVVAEVYAENDKSIQLLRKCGFQQVELNIDQQSCFNVDMTSRLNFKLLLE